MKTIAKFGIVAGAAAAFFFWQRRELSPVWLLSAQAERMSEASDRLFTLIDATETVINGVSNIPSPACVLTQDECDHTLCDPMNCPHAYQS